MVRRRSSFWPFGLAALVGLALFIALCLRHQDALFSLFCPVAPPCPLVCPSGTATGARPVGDAPDPPPLLDLRQEARLREILTRLNEKGITVGLQVLELEEGRSLFSHEPLRPLVPASNVKLASTAAALHALGPGYRFTTRLLRRGSLGPDGVLAGDLVVVGGGDPMLSSERLTMLAESLKTRGLSRVRGDLVVDDSFFTQTRQGPGWDEDDSDHYYQAPMGAFSAHYNSVWVHVLPGRPGAPVRVVTIPESSYLEIENMAVTREDTRGRLTVHTPPLGERNAVRVEGDMRPGSPRRAFYLKIDNPPLYAGMSLRDTLARHGVKIDGKVRTGLRESGDRLLLSFRSPPLAQVATLINKSSNNHAAEQLILTLAAERGPQPDWEGGMEQVRGFLHETLGLSPEGVTLKNGSGLGMINRAPADFFARLLFRVAAMSRFGPEFVASLAIAGNDGTLSGQFKEKDREQELLMRGKTGTLMDVLALSGYLERTDGLRLAVSLIFNGCSGHNRLELRAEQERILRLLAGQAPPEDPSQTR